MHPLHLISHSPPCDCPSRSKGLATPARSLATLGSRPVNDQTQTPRPKMKWGLDRDTLYIGGRHGDVLRQIYIAHIPFFLSNLTPPKQLKFWFLIARPTKQPNPIPPLSWPPGSSASCFTLVVPIRTRNLSPAPDLHPDAYSLPGALIPQGTPLSPLILNITHPFPSSSSAGPGGASSPALPEDAHSGGVPVYEWIASLRGRGTEHARHCRLLVAR